MYNFEGKTALVTGAGQGIGRAITLALAEQGAKVIALSRTKSYLDSLILENSSIKAVCFDLTNFDDLPKTIESLLPIHLLVNNAGIAISAPALDTTLDIFEKTFSVHVKASMVITQIVCKDLIARDTKGNIVNISSVGGEKPVKGFMAYDCAKAAMNMMTKVFCLELASKGIRINAVSPTVVMTANAKTILDKDPTLTAQLIAQIPQGKWAELEDVVNAVVFLLSDQSDMINGHMLPVDGGQLAV